MAAYVMVVYRGFGVAEAAWNPSNLEVHASMQSQCTGPDEATDTDTCAVSRSQACVQKIRAPVLYYVPGCRGQ